MNSLLIYNNNIAYTIFDNFENSKLGNAYFFQLDKQELIAENFSVDKKIQDILTTKIAQKRYDVIFIPYSLSEVNYLEFIGLRFACHIRLTPEFNNIQTPIVFYGFEDAITINKLSELGLILFTKKVSQTNKITVEEFKTQIELIQQQESENGTPLSDEEFVNAFVKKIQITPSGNYSHHHSVTNEWSIYRWAKHLGIEGETIKKIEGNIASNLYFKYVKAKYPIKPGASVKPEKLSGKGRILLIDDEVAKGWDSIYKEVCKGQKEYYSFGEDFKKWDTKTIFTETISKIKVIDPDVVILDFRLHDDDFETSDIEEITGYKILNEIKEKINPGIQVIISSATNNILNLQTLQEAGAADFILKESPELSADAEYSKSSIDKLTKSLSRAFEMSFLKDVDLEMIDIEAILPNGTVEENGFSIRVENNLNVAYKLLKESYTTPKYFNYAFLQLFQIIEDFSHLSYVFKEDSYSSVFVNRKEILVLQPFRGISETAIKWVGNDGKYKLGREEKNVNRLDVNFKVSAIVIFRLGIESSSHLKWTDIYNNRNKKAAHFNPKDTVKQGDIFTILTFIKNLIDPANQNETNLNKGLSQRPILSAIKPFPKVPKK